ncbi:hypothetical protein ACFVJ9_53530, partial [Streptomyces sp. NPDC127574]
MRAARTRGIPGLLVALALAALVMLSFAPGAHAATSVSTVAAALRESPVYVDPAAADQLSAR